MKKSKKNILVLLGLGLVVAVFRFGMVAGAASKTPGSSGDPLITQSYLELRISELETGKNAGYQKVSVTKGKSLTLEDGGEFVIYTGTAAIIGGRGMLNVTSGSLENANSQTHKYQQYLSLGSDSGVTATTNCIIYVKGNYILK